MVSRLTVLEIVCGVKVDSVRDCLWRQGRGSVRDG